MKRFVLAVGVAFLAIAAHGCSTSAECEALCDRGRECLDASSDEENRCRDRCDTIGDQSDNNADAVNDCRDCIRDATCDAAFPDGDGVSSGSCARRCSVVQPALELLGAGGTGGTGGTGGSGGEGGAGGA